MGDWVRNADGVLVRAPTKGIGSLAGSFFTPARIITGFGSFVGNRMDAADARREEAERQRQVALDDLVALGMDPRELYSPEAVAGNITDYSVFDDPSVDYQTLSQDKIMGDLQNYIAFNPNRVAPGAPPSKYPANNFSPTEYGRDVVDTVGDIWNDPSRVFGVVFGPGGVTGNIEWGGGTMPSTPGSDPAIYTGSPAEGVYTGVTTGNTVIDAAIRKVLGQTVGGETTTGDVVAEQVAKETGYPIDEVIDILEGVFRDTGAGMPTPTTPTGGTPTGATPPTDPTTTLPPDQIPSTTIGVGDTQSTYQKILDWLGRNKDATDEEIRTAAEEAGVTPGDIAGATNTSIDEVQRRWDAAGEVIDSTGGVLDSPGTGDVIDPNVPPGHGPGDILEPDDSGNVLDVPTGPGGGGGGGGGGTTTTPTSQGIRGVATEKAGLANIRSPFDLNASLAENIRRIISSNESDSKSTPYYGGGQVRRGDLDELIRLIRG